MTIDELYNKCKELMANPDEIKSNTLTDLTEIASSLNYALEFHIGHNLTPYVQGFTLEPIESDKE